MKYLLVSLFFLLTSCSFNVSLAHTEGVAEDVIDDTANNAPNVSPDFSIPIHP